jgi:uncharacterized membrane protein
MNIDVHAPDLITLAAALLALVAGAVLWRRRKNRLLVWWRLATLGMVLVLVLQPASVRVSGREKPVVAVACDMSPSMYLAGRTAAAREFVRRRLAKQERTWDIRYYAFARGADRAESADAVFAARPRSVTDLRRSLGEIRRDAGERLAGIIVLSDFNHTADTMVPGWAGELNVPVFPIVTGTGCRIRDAAIEGIRVSDFAFKNVPVDLAVQAGVQGISGELTVRLKNTATGAVLVAQRLRVADGDRLREVPLRFTPDAGGRLRLTAEIEPCAGEISAENNRREFSLDVVRDKLRVLYLCGQPGPEYAFLRHALKSDPAVELVSFVILRNPESVALVPENDLALIPFPVQTIFTRDLYDFDVLILENFTYQRFGFLPEYLQNIRSWVTEKGGGLVMVGGRNSFGSGGWGGTPVEDILPVLLEKPGEAYENGLFRPQIENRDHYILAGPGDRAGGDRSWADIPELDGCQPLRARPGASVLARHPWKNWTVLAAWEKGRGRVAALGANTTWRWALGSQTPERYSRFWKNMVRYLARSGESRQLRLMFDRPEYAAGERFELKARSLDRSAGDVLRVTVTDPSGRRTALAAATAGEKEWVCRGTLDEAGAYGFEAVLERRGAVAGREEITLRVEAALHGEESQFAVNESLAGDIARDSGGAVFAAESFEPERVSALMRRQEPKGAREKKPLWTSPFLFALLAASLVGEWFLRKRMGYA